MQEIEIIQADLTVETHQQAVISLLDEFAQDPIGNGKPLSHEVKAKLIGGLREHPTTLIFLARHESKSVGIAVCFRGFSTFAARPLLNIHDFYVVPELRGKSIGRLLLESVERAATAANCCKLTLEADELNSRALSLYGSRGFSRTSAAEGAGAALYLWKRLS